MGPLFSAGFVLIVSTIAIILLFAVARIFLPARTSLIPAVLLVVSGGAGCMAGVAIQLPFLNATLSSYGEVVTFLGITIVTGCLSAALSGFAFLLTRKRRREKDNRRSA